MELKRIETFTCITCGHYRSNHDILMLRYANEFPSQSNIAPCLHEDCECAEYEDAPTPLAEPVYVRTKLYPRNVLRVLTDADPEWEQHIGTWISYKWQVLTKDLNGAVEGYMAEEVELVAENEKGEIMEKFGELGGETT